MMINGVKITLGDESMTEEFNPSYWRKCGSCKKEIGFGVVYQVCGISSCQKFAYCSVDCWSLHNSILNHKSAWSEDRYAPSKAQFNGQQASSGSNETKKRLIVTNPVSKTIEKSFDEGSQHEQDILIVASKLKQYVKDKHDMNTSANVMEELSDYVRMIVDKAVMNARSEARKTLMGRDFH